MTITKTDKVYYRTPVYAIDGACLTEETLSDDYHWYFCKMTNDELATFEYKHLLGDRVYVSFDGLHVWKLVFIEPDRNDVYFEIMPDKEVYCKFDSWLLDNCGSFENLDKFKVWIERKDNEFVVYFVEDDETLPWSHRPGFGRYTYKCSFMSVNKDTSFETYADDLYDMVKEGQIVPYEEGDHIEKFVYERLNGGFVERFEEDHVVDKNGKIKM